MLCPPARAQDPEGHQARSRSSGNAPEDYVHPSLQEHMHTLTPCQVQPTSPGAGFHPQLLSCPVQSPDILSTSWQGKLVSWIPSGRVAVPLPFPEQGHARRGLEVSSIPWRAKVKEEGLSKTPRIPLLRRGVVPLPQFFLSTNCSQDTTWPAGLPSLPLLPVPSFWTDLLPLGENSD